MDAADTTLKSQPARPVLDAAAQAFADGRHKIDIACDPGLSLPPNEVEALGEMTVRAVELTIGRAFPEGRAGHIWIRLTHEGGRVKLSVSDDGVGAPEDAPAGFDRIEALAARLGGFARMGTRLFGGSEIAVVYRAG